MSAERDIHARHGQTHTGRGDQLAGCYEHSWAVVIGINDYVHVEKLDYARADADAVASALADLGFASDRTFVLLDSQATRQNIQDLLSVDLARKAGPNDRLFVFFAGHGQDYTDAAGHKRGYFIPVDGDPSYLTSRCLSMSDVDTWSDLIPAKHILYVMDCCYSGLAATRQAGLDPHHTNYISQVTQRPVRQVITAGRADEKVIEESGQGVFTRVLLRGLRGEADLAGRGFITGFDLGHYLESRVHEESNWRQQPLFRYLRGDGEFIVLCPVGDGPTPPSAELFAQSAPPPLVPISTPATPSVQPDAALEELRRGIQFDVDECQRAIHLAQGSKSYIVKVHASRFTDWRKAAELGWPEGQWLFGR